MNPEQRSLRAQIAATARHNPNDPALTDARRELKASRLSDYIQRVVDEAPPLTTEQRHSIAAALSPGSYNPARGDAA